MTGTDSRENLTRTGENDGDETCKLLPELYELKLGRQHQLLISGMNDTNRDQTRMKYVLKYPNQRGRDKNLSTSQRRRTGQDSLDRLECCMTRGWKTGNNDT